MSTTLLTNVISIRGEDYEVREIDGKTMREVLKRVKDAPETVQGYIAWKCSVRPAFENEGAAANAPHLVLRLISEEAQRLSTPETPKEGDAKND
jgi:hypothetical protein